MARSRRGGRDPEALKRYEFQGFLNFPRRPEPRGLGLEGTDLGPDLVPVYRTKRTLLRREERLQAVELSIVSQRINYTVL